MLEKRPPIVTVLGHVDHGKTTLLDAIRKTNVASREAGGITQSIGASIVTTKSGQRVTFLDTPGHAAFSGMRLRCTRVADIAVLVVSADDGAMPQTIEAIRCIKEAKTPFLVAITKIDLPNANPEAAKASLEKLEIFFEGRGGDTPVVGVSGKTGQGVDELLELLILMAEVNDIKGDPEADLQAVVIETSKSKAGLTASVVVRDGTLARGQNVIAGSVAGRVRGLFDYQSRPVTRILPGEPGLVLGFEKIPAVGSVVELVEDGEVKQSEAKETSKKEMEEGQLPVVIKAGNFGSLEAILSSLPSKVFVVSASVGELSEGDVFLARAKAGTRIFVFDTKVPASVAKLAEMEKIQIESFNVIYKFLERIEEVIAGKTVRIVGRAEIIAEFPFNGKRVAGCRLTMGKISRGDRLVLKRVQKEMGEARAVSLRKGKEDRVVITEGEFGVVLDPQLDFVIGEVLESQSSG